MFKILVINYFKNKVEGYKQQDRRNQLENDEDNYIDEHWCLTCLKGCCQKCGIKFNIETKNARISSNFTAQRVDGSVSHCVDNCEAWCVYCNCSAS